MVRCQRPMVPLLAPFIPWLLAVICEFWPEPDLIAHQAKTWFASTLGYFGLGMLAANLLWLRSFEKVEAGPDGPCQRKRKGA